MPLIPGSRLDVYEVTAQLGQGGMGEVYRARDTKLNRDVALKILPDAFADDPDRLARFRREAQTLAALNHPNIAAIYGLEVGRVGRVGQVGEGSPYLVMELVEGEDLSAHIARGAMPIAEVVPIARQIAEALEAAHESGIVHRDLKPANIKLRPDGTVKVLDFGLAKAFDPASEAGGAGRPGGENLSHSPTITSPALTVAGMILGTAAYMSPEQARGKPVDKRTDIWAFGCVVFEMLSGRAAFAGETISDTIAAILQREPEWSALPAGLSSKIGNLLRRCLNKDPRQRLRDIGDARFEIDAAQSTPPLESRAATASDVRRSTWSRVMPWVIAAVAAALAAVALRSPWASQQRTSSPEAPLRLTADLGTDASLADTGYGSAAILSPDGATLAFVGQKSDKQTRLLYVRPLTQLQATLLSDTDDAESPFFSPDGQWLAFFANGKLKKIAVTGGAAVALCDAANGRGGAWSEDGTIVFSPKSGAGVSLLSVSSAGGKPEPLTSLADGEVSQRWPEVLPGGKAVLFTASNTPVEFNQANLVVQTLPSGPRKVVQRGGHYGRYLASGHLLYVRDGSLFAVPFDLTRLEVTGPPARIVESLYANSTAGGAQFAVSASGRLLYAAGQTSSLALEWMYRDGRTTPLGPTPTGGYNPQLSPDGHLLSINVVDGQNDIWIYESARDTRTRLTFDGADDRKPVWTRDGRRLVFASTRADQSTPNLYWRTADGTGNDQRLTESKNPQLPASVHPNGRLVAFEELTPATSFDLMVLPLTGDEASGWKPGTPTVFLSTPAAELEPVFSPDGRWLAYYSNETGRDEVYVRPFPGPGGKWQISSGGGTFPTWSRTKRELFYGTANGQLMVAPFTVEGDSFRAEQPRLWSGGRFTPLGPNRVFDLHPDGERFVLEPAGQSQLSRRNQVTFVFNVFDELRRMAPVTTR